MTLLICDLHDLYNITNNGTALNVNVTKYFMISGQRQAYRFGCFYEFFKLNKLHNTFFLSNKFKIMPNSYMQINTYFLLLLVRRFNK